MTERAAAPLIVSPYSCTYVSVCTCVCTSTHSWRVGGRCAHLKLFQKISQHILLLLCTVITLLWYLVNIRLFNLVARRIYKVSKDWTIQSHQMALMWDGNTLGKDHLSTLLKTHKQNPVISFLSSIILASKLNLPTYSHRRDMSFNFYTEQSSNPRKNVCLQSGCCFQFISQ